MGSGQVAESQRGYKYRALYGTFISFAITVRKRRCTTHHAHGPKPPAEKGLSPGMYVGYDTIEKQHGRDTTDEEDEEEKASKFAWG